MLVKGKAEGEKRRREQSTVIVSSQTCFWRRTVRCGGGSCSTATTRCTNTRRRLIGATSTALKSNRACRRSSVEARFYRECTLSPACVRRSRMCFMSLLRSRLPRSLRAYHHRRGGIDSIFPSLAFTPPFQGGNDVLTVCTPSSEAFPGDQTLATALQLTRFLKMTFHLFLTTAPASRTHRRSSVSAVAKVPVGTHRTH